MHIIFDKKHFESLKVFSLEIVSVFNMTLQVKRLSKAFKSGEKGVKHFSGRYDTMPVSIFKLFKDFKMYIETEPCLHIFHLPPHFVRLWTISTGK